MFVLLPSLSQLGTIHLGWGKRQRLPWKIQVLNT